MFRAYISVESVFHTLEDLSRILGSEPTEGNTKGSISTFSKRVREESSWRRELYWPADVHPGTEGLELALEGLGDLLAERVSELVSRGCVATVVVIQELSDDSWSIGLSLSPLAVRWISRAGAAVFLDQYVFNQPRLHRWYLFVELLERTDVS